MSPKTRKERKPKNLSDFEEKIIIDLKLKGLSFNEIREHFAVVHNIDVSHRKIRKVLIETGKKARRLNGFYDSLVSEKIKIAEIDEIYQGMEGMFVGTVDKASTYLMSLSQFTGKSIEELSIVLNPVAERFTNIEIAITDGLPSYGQIIGNIFSNSVHIICHVHAYRDILKEQDVYNRNASRAYTKLKDCRDTIKKNESNRKQNEKKVKYYLNELEAAEKERDLFNKQHNITKYSKTRKFKKQRKAFGKQISLLRSYARSYQKAVDNFIKKNSGKEKELSRLEQDYNAKKTESLQVGRMVREFKRLLDSSADDYPKLHARLLEKLANSGYKFAQSLKKLIHNKPKIFSDKMPAIQALISPNYANTNTIESIFGRYRLFFRKYRKITDTKVSRAIFEILRLKHNLTRPYTGPNHDQSPIERLGIHTWYQNYLDSLFVNSN